VRPRGQQAAHHPASARVRLQAGQGRRFRRAHEVKLGEHSQARQQLPQVGRLHHLSEEDQRPVDGRGPESRQRLLDRQACRLHHLNEAEANPSDDLHSLARQPTRLEHRERRRRLLSALRRHRQNVAGRQLTIWARVRLPVRLVVHLNVSASALRRQWALRKASAAAESRGHCSQLAPARPGILAENSERHRGYVIPAAPLPWAALLAERMARDNRVRALINPAGRRELECLLLQSMARDSRSMERKSPHLHQGHNNSGAIFTAAPEKNSGAAFFV
jgi:hypothetical protein